MRLNKVIIHKILKETHSEAQLIVRDEELQINEPVIKLVSDINSLYNGKANKGYGRFSPDETNYPVAQILKTHFNGDISFVEFVEKVVIDSKSDIIEVSH